MLNKNIVRVIMLFFLSVSLIGLNGCEKKNEMPGTQKEENSNNNQNADTTNNAVQESKIPNLEGTWTGKFDKRSATMKITDQNNTEFKGKISIAYRQAINQDISGSIDTSKNIVKMKDLLHSRFMGKYNGKLSDDNNSISGTFTMNLDGKKFSFNFKRKQ